MSMFDSINVFMVCPYCGRHDTFDAQTHDLEEVMYNFTAYEKDRLLDRSKLPVFKEYPFDKSNKVWGSQEERRVASATTSKIKNGSIRVTLDCHSPICSFYAGRRDILNQGSVSGFGRIFDGKLKIKDGVITGPVYDIELSELKSERFLNGYKKVESVHFNKLMKKYKHEPIVISNWNEGLLW